MEFNHAIFTGLVVLFLSYYIYILLSKGTKKTKLPPEAGGAWPLIGHLPLISGSSSTTLPHIALGAMADKYGPIFTIRVGVHQTLVVSSGELAKELFTANDAAVSSRPRELVAAKHLSFNYAMFGFSPYGPYWRWARKFISMELLSSRRLELLSHVRVSETVQSVNELYRLWNEKNSSGRMEIEMKQWLVDLNLNVIMRMVAGKRLYGSATDGKEAKEVLREFFHLSGLFVAADALPFLGWLDLGGYEKKMKEVVVKLNHVIGGWLDEHRRMEYPDKNDVKRDFMDVMLSAVKDTDGEGQYDGDTIIKALCLTLIGGGSDSTSIALVWALSLLLNNRHVLTKAQDELDNQIGRERRVNESDIINLVYLQAIVKETLRLYPVIPLTTREFDEDCDIGGYNIPKGTRLMVNLWKLHRDPRTWSDDVLEFRPDRFLTTQKDLDVKSQNFEIIPFGAGRRICPAMNFGLEMLQLVLANFLHAFEFSTPNNELVDMTESAGLTNSKATPLNVLVSPRLSPSLFS